MQLVQHLQFQCDLAGLRLRISHIWAAARFMHMRNMGDLWSLKPVAKTELKGEATKRESGEEIRDMQFLRKAGREAWFE